MLTDLRYAARALAARRAFSIAAILTLGLGIGMTTAVFSFLEPVVLRPLPLRDPWRLVTLCEQYPGATPDWCSIAPPNVMDIRERSRSFEALGIARSWSFTLATATGRENVPGGVVSDQAFEALGIRAQQGRLIAAGDLLGRPGNVAVISAAAWRTRFGGRPGIVGQSIVLDGEPVTVVGVLEDSAAVPLLEYVEVWRPLHIDPRSEEHREWRGFIAFGKVRRGTSVAAARADVAGIVRDLRQGHFATTPAWGITTRTLHDLIVGGVRAPMLLFFGAAALVLLIACANVANLVLARGASRGRELAVRAALGADRSRIARVLFLESLLLALMGSALGMVISEWGVQAFRALAPAGVPRIEQVKTDGVVLAFSAALAILTALIFGLVPALRGSRVDLGQALRDGGRGASRSGRLASILVVAEIAIALPLMVSALLVTRSFMAQVQWRPGFERDHLLTFSMSLPRDAFGRTADIGPLWDRVERELAAIPGVTAVGTASGGPLFGGRETSEMHVEGTPDGERASIRWFDVGPGYFSALGVPLLRGSDFDATDAYGAPFSGLINEALANRFWPGQDPIGRRLTFEVGDSRATYTVRGVVRDVPPVIPGSAVEPQLYWSNRQKPRPFTYFVVRASVPVSTLAPAIRERLTALNPAFQPGPFTPMADRFAEVMRVPLFSMSLAAVFGISALALAGIGVYGLLAHFIEQQRRDLGIRLALGAERSRVLREVAARGLRLASGGLLIGAAGTILATMTVEDFIAGISPFDAVSIGAGLGLVLAVAIVACVIPGWRASRIDPGVALTVE